MMALGCAMIVKMLILTLPLSYGSSDSIDTCGNLPVTKIVNSLGFRLEQMIETQGNYFFSPLSISVALAMVYVGARGTTREEISEALDYNIVGKNCLPNKISENFKELIRSLQNEGEDYSFLIANGAFLQRGLQITHYYYASLEKYFNSRVTYLNFAKEEIASRDKINEWVQNYTKGKIAKLLVEPLDPMTIMVLMNAVYFKGLWDLQFDENITRSGPFHRINDNSKNVEFMIMQNKVNFYYDEEKKYSIIELVYKGDNVSMILILPKNMREFPQYEMTTDLLCKIRKAFHFTVVTVMLPKFKLEFSRELSTDMQKMGMRSLFSEQADLTGIRERNDLHVSLMLHKAVIEVNEKGSEASSVTGVGIDGRKPISEKQNFLADHPFLFYIVHRPSNTVLFSGRVVDP